ncbi:MAG: HigA family addiction module antitoxin [Mariprofundaceae bacterium]|nr:HigA family addiction module antitoxin [Mariprofundaceae bacterium]
MIYLNQAASPEDLRVPPSNHLEALKGDRQGTYSIRINRQWRICFSWQDGHAYDVEITDYHERRWCGGKNMVGKRLDPIPPGEILLEDFMKPLGISINQLARDLDVPPNRISAIVNGRRAITADTAAAE